MDIEGAQNSILRKILNLKTDIRLLDYGKVFFGGFVLSVLYFLFFIIYLFVLGVYQYNTEFCYATVMTLNILIDITIVPFGILSFFVIKKRKTDKKRWIHFIFYGLWVLVGISSWVLPLKYIWVRILISILCFCLSASVFVFLLVCFTWTSDAKATQTQKRLERINQIKYIILNECVGNGSDYSEIDSCEALMNKNDGMINQIVRSPELMEKYSILSENLGDTLSEKISKYSSDQQRIDTAAIVSAVVSFVLVAVDKLHDVVSNFLTVCWKKENINPDMIDGLKSDAAVTLAKDIMILSFSFFFVILLVIIVGAVLVGFVRDVKKQRMNVKVTNLARLQLALKEINQEMIKEEKRVEKK